MKNASKYFISLVVVVILASTSFCKLIAQEPAKLTSTSTDKKCNIWISNFPKNATVIVFDADDNILSLVSTNEFGAAFIAINKAVKSTVTAKTLNGEVLVSNKVNIKLEQEQTASAAKAAEVIKA